MASDIMTILVVHGIFATTGPVVQRDVADAGTDQTPDAEGQSIWVEFVDYFKEVDVVVKALVTCDSRHLDVSTELLVDK